MRGFIRKARISNDTASVGIALPRQVANSVIIIARDAIKSANAS